MVIKIQIVYIHLRLYGRFPLVLGFKNKYLFPQKVCFWMLLFGGNKKFDVTEDDKRFSKGISVGHCM